MNDQIIQLQYELLESQSKDIEKLKAENSDLRTQLIEYYESKIDELLEDRF